MTQHVSPWVALLLACTLALPIACDDKSGDKPSADAADGKDEQAAVDPASIKADESTDGLKKLVEELGVGDAKSKAIAASLELPDAKAFFSESFDAAKADALGTEYAETAKGHPGLPGLVAQEKGKGRTELVVEKFDKGDDPNATGLQGEVLGAMTKPVALYSVRMVPPGKQTGYHLHNFVYLGGTFRLAGKMKQALATQPDSEEMAALLELRNKDREEFFKSGTLPE